MNITGIDLLMTALAEERWLHIARPLIVVLVEPKIFPTSMISATLGKLPGCRPSVTFCWV
jgi:hypothetical protein